jgi:hypothetical protein
VHWSSCDGQNSNFLRTVGLEKSSKWEKAKLQLGQFKVTGGCVAVPDCQQIWTRQLADGYAVLFVNYTRSTSVTIGNGSSSSSSRDAQATSTTAAGSVGAADANGDLGGGGGNSLTLQPCDGNNANQTWMVRARDVCVFSDRQTHIPTHIHAVEQLSPGTSCLHLVVRVVASTYSRCSLEKSVAHP